MSQHLYDKIRIALETTPGLTQKGLAERMGLNPAAINRMLYGRRNIMAEEIPVIESYIGIRLELSAPPPPASSSPEYKISPQMVPVYGMTAGGLRSDALDWVTRHPSQLGISAAFALYVATDTMEPRYFRGELVYAHPGRPPEINRDCIIEMKNGEIHITRCLRQDAATLRVIQFNPLAEQEIPREDIKAIYAVVGRG